MNGDMVYKHPICTQLEVMSMSFFCSSQDENAQSRKHSECGLSSCLLAYSYTHVLVTTSGVL